MAKIIKIKCNGPGRHLNEVNLEEALQKQVVYRGFENLGLTPKQIEEEALQKQVVYRGPKPAPAELPERLVLGCRECTAGKVIITRAMLEKIR